MTERGRVLHLIDTTGPGGAETIYLQVAAGLRERGWQPHMVVVGPGWVLERVREAGLPADVVETRGRMDIRYLLGLRRLIRRHRIDLVHAHMFSPAVYASMIGAWTDTPVVATFHGATDTSQGSIGRRFRYRLVGKRATVVCVSDRLRFDLAASAGATLSDVRVIPNGVEPEAFARGDGRALRRRYGVSDAAILVGALGNIRPAKDFRTLLEAAAALNGEPALRYAIAGQRSEPLYARLLELRDQLGLSERLSFWGFQDDVPEVMAAFDILAISSSSEGFSLAAIQAMAAGTPVVATRSGGPERIITDGEDGLLVPPGSPGELAAGIRRLVHSPELRERLVERARETVRARFSLGAMLDGYESIYDELISKR